MLQKPDSIACPVCRGKRYAKVGERSDRRRGLLGVWSLCECEGCGLISLLPTPTADQLTIFYSGYSSGDTVKFAPNRWARFPLLRKSYHWLTGEVDPRDFINPAQGARILDYGCGQAGYLVEFHSRGWAISGAEMSTTVVEACQSRGLDVHQVSNPDEIPFPEESFDVVYLMQVFEHFRDPVRLMAELARITKSGGELYLAVPNSRSIWRRIFGANWVSGWYAPFHLFHYNAECLTALAEKHGFEIIEHWSRTPLSWFLLNLKAWLHQNSNRLDLYRSPLDASPIRFFLMAFLRVVEIFVSERDCLLVKYVKRAQV